MRGKRGLYMDLICIGEILVDFLPGEGEGCFIRKPGGAPANVAVAAARNGLKAGFCGRVGDDGFGRFLADTLRENGVAFLTTEPVQKACTTMAFVSLDGQGDRSFSFARKPGADCFLTKADVDSCGLERATVLHGGSCSLSAGSAAEATVYAIHKAKTLGKLVSFDVNYREPMWDGDRRAAISAVSELLPWIDFLKFSAEEADFFPEDIAGLSLTGPELIIKTLGKAGAELYWKGRRYSAPGREVECVDATGAGDAFWGAFLSCLLINKLRTAADIREDVLLQALEYANAAASICVQSKGAMESLPSRQEICRLLGRET